MRRVLPTLITGLACSAALLSGCGGDSSARNEATAGGAGTAASTGATQAGTFPVTVPNVFGETVVDSAPSRVVSVGLTEQDTLLQLGVVPVATTEWYGDQPGAIWPWAQELLDQLGGDQPEVLDASDSIPFEKVAALAPDLIVATNAGLTQKDYDLLAQIAPTVAPVEGSTQYFSSWRDQTMQIAKALGREADGQALVDEVDAAYDDAAQAHPNWAGQSATFSQGSPSDGQLYVYPNGLSTDFLTDLGFEIPATFDRFVPKVGSQALISAENVGLLDADVVVFATENAEQFDQLQAFSTVGQLSAVEDGRAIYTDETMAGAIYFDTPLAHLYLINRLVPMLEQATAGTAPRAFPSS